MSRWTRRKKFTKKNVSQVRDVSGVYKFFDKAGNLLYVGQSQNTKYSGVKKRVQSYYHAGAKKRNPRTVQWRSRIDTFAIKETRRLDSTERRAQRGATWNLHSKKTKRS